MHYFKFITTIFIFMLSLNVHATVGGSEEIEILGYDEKDQKVYLLRDFADETCRVSLLYYFALKHSVDQSKLIPVKSLYQNVNEVGCLNEADERRLENQIQQIKTRLKSLHRIPSKNTQIKILNTQQENGHFWQYVDDYAVDRFTQSFKIENSTHYSQTQQAISYNNSKLALTQLFTIPKQKMQIAIIQYLGVPTETGYLKNDAILLMPK